MASVRKRHALAVNEPLAVQHRAILEEVANVLHDDIVGPGVRLEARLMEREESVDVLLIVDSLPLVSCCVPAAGLSLGTVLPIHVTAWATVLAWTGTSLLPYQVHKAGWESAPTILGRNPN